MGTCGMAGGGADSCHELVEGLCRLHTGWEARSRCWTELWATVCSWAVMLRALLWNTRLRAGGGGGKACWQLGTASEARQATVIWCRSVVRVELGGSSAVVRHLIHARPAP